MPTHQPRKPNQSRRSFLRKAVAGAGATAAAVVTPRRAEAAVQQGSQNATAVDGGADSRAGRIRSRQGRAAGHVRVSDDRRAGVRARVQGRRRGGAVCVSRQLSGDPRAGRCRHTRLRRASRRIDGPRRRRVHPRDRRDRRVVRHRGSGLHRHDLRHCLRQRRPHAAARRREQHVDRDGRHRGRHSARLSAADDGRAEEVRQAVDHPAPRPRIRRLRVPPVEERRARTGPPRLPGRGRVGALQGRHRARFLPRQVALSHRLAPASVAERHRQGRRADQDRATPDHRVEQRRVLRQSVGGIEARRREGADPGGRVRRHEGPVLGRQSAVGQCRAGRARQRRSGDPGRPALHADRGRVRLRAGCEVHPHRPVA